MLLVPSPCFKGDARDPKVVRNLEPKKAFWISVVYRLFSRFSISFLATQISSKVFHLLFHTKNTCTKTTLFQFIRISRVALVCMVFRF